MHSHRGFGSGRLLAILALAALVSGVSVEPSHTAGLSNSIADTPSARALEPTRRVNAPYFDGAVRFSETAIFWFGRVGSTSNYADVRVGYNDEELYVRVAVFDRWLWYDTSPSPDDLTDWDAITLYLHAGGNDAETPDANAYRFVGQLNWFEERESFQAVHRGDGSGWVSAAIPFTTASGWRGSAPNDNHEDDRGWALTFRVPFAGVGLAGPPPPGTVWGMGMVLHDRDDEAGTSIADQTWPETLRTHRPATWGQLAFGVPRHTPPTTGNDRTVVVRHKLNGAVVSDAAVGGTIDNLCPGDPDYIWNQWGNDSFAGATNFNVQNQSDVADWPCFAKYYVTFPLGQIPPGQAIVSATLTLHQFGNSGGGSWGDAEPSLIQVLTVLDDWEETALTWNNAPLAAENVSAAWVDPISSFPGWPGVAREWEITQATTEAYAAGEPLRLALYGADSAYHSGKYFVSSDTGDWNEEGRPTLTVVYGDPLVPLRKEVRPVAPSQDQTVTYTVSLLGNGQALTLTDDLPSEVSAPGPIRVSDGAAAVYDPEAHRLTWNGSPGDQEPVAITFPVTVQVSGPLVVYNTVVMTDSAAVVSRDTATFIVDARQVWLPTLMRSQ